MSISKANAALLPKIAARYLRHEKYKTCYQGGLSVPVPDYIFKVEHKKQTTPYSMPRKHFHNYHEIYYLTSGERMYLLEDRFCHVHQGELVLIPKTIIHRTTDAGADTHERYILYFKEGFLHGLLTTKEIAELMTCLNGEAKVIRLSTAEQGFVVTTFKRLLADEDDSCGCGLLRKRLLVANLLVFIRTLDASQIRSFDDLCSTHGKVDRIVRFIRENYDKHLSLTTISRQFYISPCYLSRLFRRTTGITLIEYLNNVRVKEAQRLLKDSDYSVTDIAARVGYENQTHFGRVFKRVSGTSPLRYRKQSREAG